MLGGGSRPPSAKMFMLGGRSRPPSVKSVKLGGGVSHVFSCAPPPRSDVRVEILLRGEHFPLENFIHSVNIGVLITKTPRISATSFSPPGGKKVSLHTYWQPTTLAPPKRTQ